MLVLSRIYFVFCFLRNGTNIEENVNVCTWLVFKILQFKFFLHPSATQISRIHPPSTMTLCLTYCVNSLQSSFEYWLHIDLQYLLRISCLYTEDSWMGNSLALSGLFGSTTAFPKAYCLNPLCSSCASFVLQQALRSSSCWIGDAEDNEVVKIRYTLNDKRKVYCDDNVNRRIKSIIFGCCNYG